MSKIKKQIQRLFGISQPPTTPEPPPTAAKTDAEYEATFGRLLEGVKNGWSRGNVLGFLIGEKTTEGELSAWLRPFGETLLASPTQHEDLALGMRQLGDLSCGELSDVAGKIASEILAHFPPPPEPEYTGNEIIEAEFLGDGISVPDEIRSGS